jgi:protein-tyrosine phosphatase
MYKQDDRCKVRSAGLSPQSERKLSEQDLHWADLVLVMETDQRSKIRSLYGQLELPEILVLDIPDEYEFMDEELVDMLHDKIEALLQTRYDL